MTAHGIVLHGFGLGAIRLLLVPHINIVESSASIAHILHAFLEEGLVLLLQGLAFALHTFSYESAHAC